MVGQPKIDGVECSSLGLTLKTQDVPRGCAQTDVRTVAGRAYADLTYRPSGYARRGPMTAKLLFWSGPGEERAEAGVRAAMAWDGKRVEYEPPDFGGVSFRGVAAVSVTSRTVNRAEVAVTLTADPVAYGAARRVALSAGSNAVKVGGSYPTRPVLRLAASSASAVPSVTLAGTGESLALLSAPGQGKAVVLDCGERTATVAGAASRVTMQSDWFELPPGDCTLLLSGAAGTLEYRERWA